MTKAYHPLIKTGKDYMIDSHTYTWESSYKLALLHNYRAEEFPELLVAVTKVSTDFRYDKADASEIDQYAEDPYQDYLKQLKVTL